jgi:phosphotransferase system HPr (HPr) family protein
MQTRTVTLRGENGLHARVAVRIVQWARRFEARLRIGRGGNQNADARSILQLLSLGAASGERLEITAEGPDEEAALKRFAEEFKDGGGI